MAWVLNAWGVVLVSRDTSIPLFTNYTSREAHFSLHLNKQPWKNSKRENDKNLYKTYLETRWKLLEAEILLQSHKKNKSNFNCLVKIVNFLTYWTDLKTCMFKLVHVNELYLTVVVKQSFSSHRMVEVCSITPCCVFNTSKYWTRSFSKKKRKKRKNQTMTGNLKKRAFINNSVYW